jgi:hypothetical protein
MRVRSLLDGSQSCLLSLVVHLVMLVMLGFLTVSTRAQGDQMPLLVAMPEAEEVEEFAISPAEGIVVEPTAEMTAPEDEIADFTDVPKLSTDTSEVNVDDVDFAKAEIGLETLSRVPFDVEVASRAAETNAVATEVAVPAVGFNAEAYASAGKRIGKGYGDQLRALTELPKDYVLVVRGAHDQMETVLAHYKIPHRIVDALRVDDLRNVKILCLNCGSEAIDRALLRRWVEAGGVIVSSDYALTTVAAGFPDYLTQAPGASGDEVFPIKRRGKDAGLLKGVFTKDEVPQWWLESASYFVNVDAYKVEILATSDAMAKQHNTSNVVACHFKHGRGRVMHLVGHFHQRRGNVDGLVAMHRLVFNLFLEEAPK